MKPAECLRRCSVVYSGTTAAAAARAQAGSVAAPGARAFASAGHRLAAAAARPPPRLPETARQPAAAARRHRLLRVPGRRLPAARDTVDAARTPARRQGQVGFEQTDTHTDVHITILRSPLLYSSGDMLSDRQTDRHTHTQTCTSRYSAPLLCIVPEICSRTDRQTDRQTHRHTDVHITVLRCPSLYSSGDMLADRQTDRQTQRHTDVHITVLCSPPLYSSGDMLADRQTDRHKDTQTCMSQYFAPLLCIVLEICSQTDRRTDTETRRRSPHNTRLPSSGLVAATARRQGPISSGIVVVVRDQHADCS